MKWKSLILPVVAGTIAMTVWGGLFWAASPIPSLFMNVVEDEAVLNQALSEALPASGAYFVPRLHEGETMDDFVARHEQGPLVQIMYVQEGHTPMGARTRILGTLHFLAATTLAVFLLMRFGRPGLSYKEKVLVFAAFGGLIGIYSDLGDPIWFHVPWGFHIMVTFFDLSIWAVGGAAMAGLVESGSWQEEAAEQAATEAA